MSRILLLILVLISPIIAFAQTEEDSHYKFDEIGKAGDKELRSRIENLKLELASDLNMKAFIVNYGTAKQIRKRVRQIRKALGFHKIDPKNVEIVYGGASLIDTVRTTIWIVPKELEPPKP